MASHNKLVVHNHLKKEHKESVTLLALLRLLFHNWWQDGGSEVFAEVQTEDLGDTDGLRDVTVH